MITCPVVTFPLTEAPFPDSSPHQFLTSHDYDLIEQQWLALFTLDNLDQKLALGTINVFNLEKAVIIAIQSAYTIPLSDPAAHRFLQRMLYRLNRLKLFWYDDLRHYTNEQSLYLRTLRDQIEVAWQQWELTQLEVTNYPKIDVKQALQQRTLADIDPPLSDDQLYLRDQVSSIGYRHLVAITSLDGLVEASQLSRTLGGVANEIQAVLTRLFIEEYGGGRLRRKHSSHFITMLKELGMKTEPEAYFDVVPWQVLALINQSFLLTERKRYFLRYIGGLLYGELTVPSAFRNYQIAGQRLGLSPEAMSYWTLHIKVDELHGRWMLEDVALPLVEGASHFCQKC